MMVIFNGRSGRVNNTHITSYYSSITVVLNQLIVVEAPAISY